MNQRIKIADAFRHLNPKQGLSEGISSGFSRIGYKDKVWCLFYQGDRFLFVRDDDGTQLPYIDFVIVGAARNNSKLYYPPGTYTQDASNPPVCASTNGDVPDEGVAIKQSPSCHTCKHNQWKPNRGGKDCQDHRRAAVVLLPYMKTKPKLSAPLIEPIFFKIPPASLKSWKAYVDELEDEGVPIASVITRVTFSTDKQFQMIFNVKEALTDKEAPLVLPLLQDRRTLNLIGTMAEYRTLEDQAVPVPAIEERQETGLAAAFAQQTAQNTAQELIAPPKRGRPKGKPAVEEVEEVEQPATQGTQAGEATLPWEEGTDAELDSMMQDVLSEKTSKMMK